MAAGQGGKPTYSLAEIKTLIKERRDETSITTQAQKDGFRLGHDRESILTVVESLDAKDFEKTMPAKNAPGLFQDVYKRQVGVDPLYVKLQIGANKRVVVISFHRE